MSGGTYWEAQERVGQVSLSARDTLVVSIVKHGAQWFARLRVHQTVGEGATQRQVPGKQGLIVPIEQAAAVAALLTQAVEQVPKRRFPG